MNRPGTWPCRLRRVGLAVAGAAVLALLAYPAATASDLFQNIGPAPQVGGGLKDAYPLGRYSLDHHFDAVQAGLLKGVDVSGIPPTIAWMLAQVLWTLTAFLAQTVISLFEFAFSLDLLGGERGALEPVSRAVRSIYASTFGAPWLTLAILIAGLWAIYQALVRRRFAATAGSLALSVVLVVTALAFVAQPERTIGSASRLSNQMSVAFLSLTSSGTVSNPDAARRAASDQLFGLLVYRPWVVLQFGGLEHCVRNPTAKDPDSVAVRPLSSNPDRDARLAARLRADGEVQADDKTCVHNERKYAERFLRFGAGSDERKKAYEGLRDGTKDKLDDDDPSKRDPSYRLSPVDKSAAEAMGKDGQYQRLLLALVVFVAELGALLLIGALSIGVILAQILVLLLLAFAPVVLVIAVFPGRGHAFFLGWLTRLAELLLRKAVYSLLLAVLLAVVAALQEATSSLGWLMAFGLQATFFWTVFLLRRQLVGGFTAATTGAQGTGDASPVRAAGLYYAASRLVPRRRLGSAPAAPRDPDRDNDPKTNDDDSQKDDTKKNDGHRATPAPPPVDTTNAPSTDPDRRSADAPAEHTERSSAHPRSGAAAPPNLPSPEPSGSTSVPPPAPSPAERSSTPNREDSASETTTGRAAQAHERPVPSPRNATRRTDPADRRESADASPSTPPDQHPHAGDQGDPSPAAPVPSEAHGHGTDSTSPLVRELDADEQEAAKRPAPQEQPASAGPVRPNVKRRDTAPQSDDSAAAPPEVES